MPVFRRPELEKDNPTAPQPYAGPRRKQAQARAASAAQSAGADPIQDSLQVLSAAASRFVKSLPKARQTGEGFKALRDAMAQAERVLAAEGRPGI